MNGKIVTLFSVILVVALVLAVAQALKFKPEPPKREMGLRYHPIAMEGISCSVAGVQVECGALDVRKVKAGGITLGGFNQLEIENLCLTMYDDDRKEQAKGRQAKGGQIEEKCVKLVSNAANPMSVVGALMPRGTKVSGIRIRGMKIMRSAKDGDRVPWLEAALVRNAGRDLRISGLVETVEGVRHVVGDARLIVKDGYYLECGTNANERIKLL